MKISGNKGEWSEFYTLIRLLADGEIYTADENLSKNENCYFPILKIFRCEDKINKVEYRLNFQNDVELYLNGKFLRNIKTSVLDTAAKNFFDAICKGKGSFEIDGAEKIMKTLECTKIKADSKNKTDITLEIYDPFTRYGRICGYSIKSDIGNPPTLFNSSQATNFKFEIFDMNDEKMDEINAIDTRNKIKDRVRRISDMQFDSLENETFSRNLLFVDTNMENFLAEMLKVYYGENVSNCAEVAEISDSRNLKLENLYSHKLKKFLCAAALGLTPTKIWNGRDESDGGYIIIKKSGEILAYHLYDRDRFENYLLNSTKFDTPSAGRYNFGKIYKTGGRYFINLNLQIRFK